MIKVIFEPVESKINIYVNILVSLLKERGVSVKKLHFLTLLKMRKSRSALIHLNWFENLEGDSSSVQIRSFIRKLLQLILARILGIKMVWTMHNREPHSKKFRFLNFILLKRILSWSTRIIIHSEFSVKVLGDLYGVPKEKCWYIPHPHYIGKYGPVLENENGDSTLKLLFLGAVKPYKNIELLLSVMAKLQDFAVELLIVGKPENEMFKNQLLEYAKDLSSVHFELGFVPDDQINGYLGRCDLLVLPYDMRSSLNSGTAYLAFSYAKTVICPAIGTIQDVKDNEAVFTYSYTDEGTHVEALQQAIKRAIALKTARPDTLTMYGKRMYKEMVEYHSWDKVGSDLMHVYKEILQ